MSQIRIMAGVPTYTGQVCVPFVNSYICTWGLLANKGVQMEMECASHFSLVQYARNYIAAKFLQDETFTHLLMIDSDLGWDPRAAMRMFSRGKDVICGIYPVKTNNPYFPYVGAEDVGEDGLQLAERAPTGFMLVTREVMRKLADSVRWYDMQYNGQVISCPNIFDLVHEGAQYWGEDFAFCKRLKNHGYNIWVETDMDFSHVGTNAWTANLAKTLSRKIDPAQGVAPLQAPEVAVGGAR